MITGGTVNLLAGGGLGMDSNPANRVSALTFNGNIALADAGDRLSFGAGVTVNGVITVMGANAEIGLANGASLNSEVVFPGTAGARRIGPTGSNVSVTLGASANLHGGPFTLGTQYGGSVWGNMSVTNQGTIAADVAGQTVNISPTNFASTGTLNVGPGNMTINPQSAWTSNGSTIHVTGGTLTIDGTYTTGAGIGTWTRSGGNVNVTGVVDNTGGTLNLNGATGTWDLFGGTLTGGTVNLLPGGGLGVDNNAGNRLSNLTLNGNITLADTACPSARR